MESFRSRQANKLTPGGSTNIANSIIAKEFESINIDPTPKDKRSGSIAFSLLEVERRQTLAQS